MQIKELESYKFYTEIGLSHEQATVLSTITYGRYDTKELVDIYNKSKDRHNGLTLCESISKVIKEDNNENDLYSIIERYKKYNGIKVKDETERGGLFSGLFGAPRVKTKSVGFASSVSSFSNAPSFGGNVGLSCNTPSQNNVDSFDEEFEADAFCCNSADVYCDSMLCEDVEYDCDDDDDCFECEAEYSTESFGSSGGFGGSSVNRAMLSSCIPVNNSQAIKQIANALRTDKYEHINEKGFKNVLNNPTSTFRTTCNRASIDILNNTNRFGYLSIEKSMVKPEEILNYFDYEIDSGVGKKFSIHAEMCDKPNSKNKLLFVGIKGEEKIPSKQNIVILLDVSGSMSGQEQETQATIMAIVSKLNTGDKLSLITYSDDDTVVIDDITIGNNSIDFIIERLLQIEITGCTYGSKGLNSAYSIIHKNYDKDGINRIVLITDGDFNFGDCDTDSVERLILEKKKTGAFLSLVGVGSINYNDELMNTLAKNGNGSYAYVSNFSTVKENIDIGYKKLIFSIAKDVKAQIEFNPKYVKEYRLIGYENREISHEDFSNDKVIAEPFGSGAQAVAIYEIVPNNLDSKTDKGLKYQTVNTVESDELCTVSIRYKEVDFAEYDENASSKLIEKSFKLSSIEKSEMTFNTKLAYIIYIVSEHLRNSEFVDSIDIEIAKKCLKELLESKNKEMVEFKIKMLQELLK